MVFRSIHSPDALLDRVVNRRDESVLERYLEVFIHPMLSLIEL